MFFVSMKETYHLLHGLSIFICRSRNKNEKIIYKSGDGIFIPDGSEHKHQGKALTKKVLVFFIEKV